jgi:hypothetical protein
LRSAWFLSARRKGRSEKVGGTGEGIGQLHPGVT